MYIFLKKIQNTNMKPSIIFDENKKSKIENEYFNEYGYDITPSKEKNTNHFNNYVLCKQKISKLKPKK